MARDCPQPVKCSHCGKSGHADKDCWAKDPSKRPGASSTPKPVAKAKAKPAAKSKGSVDGSHWDGWHAGLWW